MKKCKYCFEEIQDEAIKCKHCGEMLNKVNPLEKITSLATNAYESYLKVKQERFDNKFAHLKLPTKTEPIEINDVLFYDTFFETKEKEIFFYKDIDFIAYDNLSESLNGIYNKQEIICLIIILNDKTKYVSEENKTIEIISKANSFSSKVDFEITQFFINYIIKITFQSRMQRALYFLKKDGYIRLGEYKLKNNGDVCFEGDEILLNIVNSFKNNLVEYGEEWSTIRGSSNYDPYTLKIYLNSKPSIKLFGIDLNKRVEINNRVNKDIIDSIIYKLLQDGFIIQEDNSNEIIQENKDIEKEIMLSNEELIKLWFNKLVSLAKLNLNTKYEDKITNILIYIEENLHCKNFVFENYNNETYEKFCDYLFLGPSEFIKEIVEEALNDDEKLKIFFSKQPQNLKYGASMEEQLLLYLAKEYNKWQMPGFCILGFASIILQVSSLNEKYRNIKN